MKNDSYKSGDKINGIVFIRHISKGTSRKAEFICPSCKSLWITRLSKVKNEGVKMCISCSTLLKLAKMKEYNLKNPRKSINNEGLKNGAFGLIKKSSIQRNISFQLSKKDVLEIIIKNCFYCGSIPNQVKKNLSQKFIHHGIDRKDNDKGYEYGNVVACCKICNRAKNNLKIEEWNLYLDQLVEYIKK